MKLRLNLATFSTHVNLIHVKKVDQMQMGKNHEFENFGLYPCLENWP